MEPYDVPETPIIREGESLLSPNPALDEMMSPTEAPLPLVKNTDPPRRHDFRRLSVISLQLKSAVDHALGIDQQEQQQQQQQQNEEEMKELVNEEEEHELMPQRPVHLCWRRVPLIMTHVCVLPLLCLILGLVIGIVVCSLHLIKQ